MVVDTNAINAEVGRIDAAAAVKNGVLTALAVVLWVLGAIPGVLVRAVVWSAVAVRVGYRDGRGAASSDRAGGRS